jgi:rhamnogalacturonyl hydrolase YesR
MLREVAKASINLLRSRPYIPCNLNTLCRDLFGASFNPIDSDKHLTAAMRWLTAAQNANRDGGVSAGYSLRWGWLPSYPETTGYIIPTFLDFYHLTGKEDYLQRAIRMADWLVSIQLAEGAFSGHYGNVRYGPIVFNTGQAMQGLVRIYKETLQAKYLDSARRSADWLVGSQDDDGAWRKFTFKDTPHVYHTRVAWPIFELYKLTQEETYLQVAIRNMEYALSNQTSNGWFKNNAFVLQEDPFLHTIAYAIEGILESAALMNNQDWMEAALKPAVILLRRFEIEGRLSGVYNDKWRGMVKYRCLTGEAQMSVCWLRLFLLTSDGRFLNAALKMNEDLKRLQDNSSSNSGINGGVKGSHPIWGKYSAYKYPNWAAKFFTDALMLEMTSLSDAALRIKKNIRSRKRPK